jgi:hypothetical protein
VILALTSPQKGPEKGRFISRHIKLIALLVVTLIALFAIPLFPVPQTTKTPEQASLDKAIGYFAKNYGTSAGLIPEKPNSTSFWVFSDNYLVMLALTRYSPQNQTLTNFAQVLNFTAQKYVYALPKGAGQNQYTALNSTRTSFSCPNDYLLTWRATSGPALPSATANAIKTTLNNGDPSCGSIGQNYADLLFLEAIYSQRRGNSTAAQAFLTAGAKDFDGVGVKDTAFTGSNSTSQGVYQTYKLALYMQASICVTHSANSSLIASLSSILLSFRDPGTGGFFTGYKAPGAVATGATVNTETTALAALALESELKPSVLGC